MRMRRGTASLIAVGAVVALCVGVLAPTAAAATFQSTVRVKAYNLGFWSGKVGSENKKCKKKRRVELYSDQTDGTDSLAGSGRTNKKGKWRFVDEHGLGGTYYAIVKQKTISGGDTCAEATSPPFIR